VKTLHHVLVAGSLCALAALATPVLAQTAATRVASAPASKVEMTEGEVRKVDKEGRKITLKHGAIKNIDMPPMTMTFQADPSMLDKVKVGDKVRFTATESGGKLILTQLQLAK
jgi:Cu(I)/Ag(I) efflux system periplasmic protein CusF